MAKAVVRLTTEALRIGEWSLDEAVTDGAGRFDLGPRPAAGYRVVAGVPIGHANVSLHGDGHSVMEVKAVGGTFLATSLLGERGYRPSVNTCAYGGVACRPPRGREFDPIHVP